MAKRYLVPAIKRAFDLIELLAQQESGLTISDVHRHMGLPLSSVATIVYTLCDLGYLERDPSILLSFERKAFWHRPPRRGSNRHREPVSQSAGRSGTRIRTDGPPGGAA